MGTSVFAFNIFFAYSFYFSLSKKLEYTKVGSMLRVGSKMKQKSLIQYGMIAMISIDQTVLQFDYYKMV